MNITIKNLSVGDGKLDRLLVLLEDEQYEWTFEPALKQANVMRAQSAEPLLGKAYCSECGAGLNSAHQHNKGCSLAGNGA